MWTRYFPAVEHARALVAAGEIGDVVMTQSDFPDKCYAVQTGPMAFGAESRPTSVVATGGKDASAAVVQYGEKGTAIFSFPPWKVRRSNEDFLSILTQNLFLSCTSFTRPNSESRKSLLEPRGVLPWTCMVTALHGSQYGHVPLYAGMSLKV